MWIKALYSFICSSLPLTFSYVMNHHIVSPLKLIRNNAKLVLSSTLKDNILNYHFSALIKFKEYLNTKRYVKIYCLSDLHVDMPKNLEWLLANSRKHIKDYNTLSVFICPGDIGSDIIQIGKAFQILKNTYDIVCYVPGNHEAWRKGYIFNEIPDKISNGITTITDDIYKHNNNIAPDSVKKLQKVLECALEHQIYIGPLRIVNSINNYNIMLFPLYSWYHSGFDREPDLIDTDFIEIEKVNIIINIYDINFVGYYKYIKNVECHNYNIKYYI